MIDVLSTMTNMAKVEGLARQLLAIGQALQIIPKDLSVSEVTNMAVDALAGVLPTTGILSKVPVTLKAVVKTVEALQQKGPIKLSSYGAEVSEVEMSKISLIATLKTYSASYLQNYLRLANLRARKSETTAEGKVIEKSVFMPVLTTRDDFLMGQIGLVDLGFLKAAVAGGKPEALSMLINNPVFQSTTEELANLLSKLRAAEDAGLIVQDLTLFPPESLKQLPSGSPISGFRGKPEIMSPLGAIGRNLKEAISGEQNDRLVPYEFDFDFAELSKSFTEIV